MRTMLTCLLALALSGCGLEILTTTAVQGQLAAQSANTASRALQYAKDSTQQNNAQRAIDLYKAEKGQNPPSLEALVPAYLDKIPTKPDGSPYGYDPSTGKLLENPVAVAAAPVAPAGANDWDSLAQINGAIQRYGKDNGVYPASLQMLVPRYLAALPRTSSGQDFVYDPRYGAAYLPQPGAAPAPAYGATAAAPAQRGMGVAGAGPMAETMTGISISNQLDNMSNAGANAAGGRAGSSLDRSQAQHNQQQEQALQNLGL